MDFNAPDIDYAGLSPIIALTGGARAGPARRAGRRAARRQRIVVSIFGLGTLGRRRGAADLAVGRAARTWSPGRCGSTTSRSPSSLIAIASAAFCIPLSWREQAFDRPLGPSGHGEFQALLICSVLGMTMIAQAQNLISFFVALELLSIPLYVLCGSALRRESRSSRGSST